MKRSLGITLAVALIAVLVIVGGNLTFTTTSVDAAGPPMASGPGELERLHQRMLPLFEIPGVVYTDALEEQGRLEVGVENKGLSQQVTKELDRLGIPPAKVDIVETKPIVPVVAADTLQSRIRPLQGGIQIAFSRYVCTLGFNAVRLSVGGFVINSHCTNKYFALDGTQHYQPLRATGNLIGTEIADPSGTKNGCPRGKVCRYSDSAFDQRASGVDATLGSIERPDSVNTGSLTIAGSFTIVGEATSNALVGETVNKVGRTTGWSQGNVTKSCVDTGVSGTNKILLCQDWVNASVGGGDSGSPVFEINSSNDVTLYGILWGGSTDNKTFVYSPISAVQAELGPLTTH
ncbi:MAG: S1 family peptidase [Actinobacteria bacterium]|nr:S1 family peptidase [Actinomycetota bacterium]